MATINGFGIIRNGEHLAVCSTREAAEQKIQAEKEFDKKWGCEARYCIVELKRRRVW